MSQNVKISLEQAAERLLAAVQPVTECERLPLAQLSGRVLCQDVTAQIDLPPFTRSPLDGYALCSADLADLDPASGVTLQVTDRVFAGMWPQTPATRGQAVRIMTGAPIPSGADCVVRQEDTDGGEKLVRVFAKLHPMENICRQGEDVLRGSLLFRRGERLDWTHIPTLAGQGIAEAAVFRRPRAAVIVTGDELLPPDHTLEKGKIFDSNGAMLCARLATLQIMAEPAIIGADAPEALADLVRRELKSHDVVITSGGVSVGQRDCMPAVAKLLGAEVLFHGVAAKPGTPTMAMRVGEQVVLCLSGNPFAAAAMFEVLARPMLQKLSGCDAWQVPRATAVLRGSFPKGSSQRRLIRGRLVGGEIYISGGHGSGMVRGMAGCNCLVDLPAGSPPIADGQPVEAFLL